MIVVTGASGLLGRAIVEQLLLRVPADRLGVSVRDPAKAADLAARGVRVRRGDYEDPASLAHAFEAAEQVLMISSNASAHGGDPIAQHVSAIGAARAAGVARIVYTSHMAASPTSAFPPSRTHAETERLLAESGLAWTALRNGFYASTVLRLLGDAKETGVVAGPADGKVSWTAHADLAEAAAVILTSPGRYEGPTPPLTASAALNLADIAAIATEAFGRPVHRRTVGDDDFRAGMIAHGLPPAIVEISMGMYVAARNGEFQTVDPTLVDLLGRPTTALRTVITGLDRA